MKHISVLLNEGIEYLNIKSDGVYVDCTLGGGGHSAEILSKLTKGHLFCFDQDQFAIDKATKKLEKIGSHFTIIKSNFQNIKNELDNLGISKVDGILYDIGVSSFHFDMSERGFSYHLEAPLDMRMNQDQELSALDVVNKYDKNSLIKLLKDYGEITYAKRLAEEIIKSRPIMTTLELVTVIQEAAPGAVRRKGHPAKQVFQAIRIEVNRELDVLKDSLKDSLTMLNDKGRIVVITFHSLEDRIVKKMFNKVSKVDIPAGVPIMEKDIPVNYKVITKKPVLPSVEEVEYNIRAHSAKLRCIEKVG